MNNIKLELIDLNAPTQLRLMKESQTHVEELAYVYSEKGEFEQKPRVALVKETGTYVPIDGFHRIRSVLWLSSEEFLARGEPLARPDLDLESIAIQYEEYETMADAIVVAAGVNSVHGLKRQKGDIKNAIRALLEVDRTRFMVDKFTLNAAAIMKVVNCSKRTYEYETKEIRQELTDYRDLTVEELSSEGLGAQAISTRTGIAPTTVKRILSASPKTQDAQMDDNEDLEVSPKTQDAQMDDNEETVFTHITAATVAANPWDAVVSTVASEVAPISLQVESEHNYSSMSDDDLTALIMGLSDAQKAHVKALLAA
tara:strand:+ start:682 stop:1620 length:939 start_codon:yes stop_codon:yes gene_type:complete